MGAFQEVKSLLEGVLKTKRIPDTRVEGNITASSGAGSEIVATIAEGMTMISAAFKGTYSTVTTIMEVSYDNGSHYMNLMGANVASGNATVNPLSSTSNATIGWEAALPAGATNVRIRCTAYTSGTVECLLAQGSAMYETAMSTFCGSTSNIIGAVFAPGQWTDISSSNIAASGSMTVPSSIDLATTATATAFNSSSIGVGEIRLSATSNVAGTLFLETSRDNVTFKKIKSIALAQATGCEFYGEIIHRPSERYMRAAFTNGASEATAFKCQMMRVGVA